eukprot:SM000044S16025  [mRNA]  locus=s44:650553:653499:+ [translate_table: standard]
MLYEDLADWEGGMEAADGSMWQRVQGSDLEAREMEDMASDNDDEEEEDDEVRSSSIGTAAVGHRQWLADDAKRDDVGGHGERQSGPGLLPQSLPGPSTTGAVAAPADGLEEPGRRASRLSTELSFLANGEGRPPHEAEGSSETAQQRPASGSRGQVVVLVEDVPEVEEPAAAAKALLPLLPPSDELLPPWGGSPRGFFSRVHSVASNSRFAALVTGGKLSSEAPDSTDAEDVAMAAGSGNNNKVVHGHKDGQEEPMLVLPMAAGARKSSSGSSSRGLEDAGLSNKRWGEGEEVPWSAAAVGDCGGGNGGADAYDSELELGPYRERGLKWTRTGCVRSVQMATGLGSLLFVSHWLMAAPSAVARHLNASPWWGALSILSLLVGLTVSAEVARKLLPSRTHGVLAWLVAALGSYWLADGAAASLQGGNNGGLGIMGGSLLALAIPSLWAVMARNNFGVYPGLGLGVAAAVYVLLIAWSTALVAYQHMPGAGALRGSAGWLLAVALVGVGAGLVRGPQVTEKERHEFGARLGAWRAGRLTWGSGVPDRRAIAMLAAVVLTLLGLSMLLRLVYAPRGAPHIDLRAGGTLRVLNFNVQQGFSRAGADNFDAVARVIWEQRPHLVTLQESDLMRIAHGNLDLVDFLATWLGWAHSLYTPTASADTWGCAILSAFPIAASSSHILPSRRGENACFQHATIVIGGEAVQLVNMHFGDLASDLSDQAGAAAAEIQQIVNVSSSAMSLAPSAAPASAPAAGPHPSKTSVLLVVGADLNLAPLTTGYNEVLSAGIYDSFAAQHGAYNSSADRDPGAGYVLASPTLHCTRWEEPRYDQSKTSDGFPQVAEFAI